MIVWPPLRHDDGAPRSQRAFSTASGRSFRRHGSIGLSIHPHILPWFASTTSEAWLRNILRRETEEARTILRGWQEKVLAYVQSTQLDSAAVLQPLLAEDPSALPPPRNTPFSRQQQAECKFDGQVEDPPDARDSGKRHLFIDTEELFVDHHVREHRQQLLLGEKPKADYLLPLTGAQVSRMPHYRLLLPRTETGPVTDEELKAEAAIYRGEFVEDYRLNMAVGQMHEHKDTCFKYESWGVHLMTVGGG